MQPLLTISEMQEADRFTIQAVGLSELVLMEHAALAAVEALQNRFHSSLSQTFGLILVGKGNNGGDALATARLLFQSIGAQFEVVLIDEPTQLSPSAALQLTTLKALGASVTSELSERSLQADWVVDGLFGIGLQREVQGKYRAVIENINKTKGAWKIALDIPSGLSAESGLPLGVALEASETVTFGFMKRGLVTGMAANYVGKLHLAPIQIPRIIANLDPGALLFEACDAKQSLPKRFPSGNKGQYGHVYVWAGRAQTEGAAALSALAALRSGSGLVSVFGAADTLSSIRHRLIPEVMTTEFKSDLFEKENSVFAIGPGMGQDAAAWELLQIALKRARLLVLDADALNLLAQHQAVSIPLCQPRSEPILMTPHPKEAARLLDTTVDKIQSDRYAAVTALAQKYRAWVLLKGSGTLVSGPDGKIWVINHGNSALSKGGSGDLLTGIVASLLGQNLNPQNALALAAYLHGRSAELLTEKRGEEFSELPSEIASNLSTVFSELLQCR